MIVVNRGIVKYFVKLIKKAEENIIMKINDGRVETEPSVTDRFFQEVERVFEENGEKNGICFRVRTLRDRGPNAPEKKFGADICGVLNVKLSEFEISKGFLAQAKNERQREICVSDTDNKVIIYNNTKLNELKDQTEKMLNITPDSFVIVYSTKKFIVVPASTIKGLKYNDMYVYNSAKLYGKPVDQFFKEFITCFIGDLKLKAYDDKTFNKINGKYSYPISYYVPDN